VDSYNTSTATLLLKDRFPAGTSSTAVNVANIIDALNVELIQVGAWVNTIGYVRESGRQITVTGSKFTMHSDLGPVTAVDAVIMWSAGAVKLDAYETAVRDLQATNGL
jgi:hypothetical protein